MKAYKALIAIDLKLALRNRSVIFFNYLFPLTFFFIFGQAMHGERGAAMTIVIAMVLIIGILGNGLMGAGIRAVLVPWRNEADLEDVPKNVRGELTVHLIKRVDEVLPLVLEPPLPPIEPAQKPQAEGEQEAQT